MTMNLRSPLFDGIRASFTRYRYGRDVGSAGLDNYRNVLHDDVFWQALGEALLLCRELKLDPRRMMDIFGDTSGGPNVLKVRGGKIAAALEGMDTGPVTFDVDSIRKDLHTMIEEAHALGAKLPVAERALACFDEAAQNGLGASDGVVLPVRWATGGARPER